MMMVMVIINKLKVAVSGLMISFLTLCILLLLAEFLVRALFQDNVVLFPRYHTDAQYGEFILRRIRENSEFWHTSADGEWKFITNNKGFRNESPVDYLKPENTIRVISLGDSHTQGYEVGQESTFSAVIERYLNHQGYQAEVINAGVSGFSTAEELVFLENEAVKYKPDYIVLGFYANDYEDNLKSGLLALDENHQLVLQKTEHIPGVKIQNLIYSFLPMKWLGENSYFYSILFNSAWNYFKAKLAKMSTVNVSTEYAIPMQSSFSQYQVDLAHALLKRIYTFCQQNGIKLLIADIPHKLYGGGVETSLVSELQSDIEQFSDGYILSESLLDDYIGAAEIHRPNGHSHISEFTHTVYGVELAKQILNLEGHPTK